jgi:malonyl-CoA/methylmalonyl-CoA synthetase
MNLHDLLAIPHQRNPDKVALHCLSHTGSSDQWSYAQLFAGAERLAAALHAWGLRKGDRAAFFLGNRLEFVVASLAVNRLGAVMVPINMRYRRREIGHILADCTPRLLFTEQSQLPILAELEENTVQTDGIIDVDNWYTWEPHQVAGETAPCPPISGDDLALILYTSGTTGRSKGAMLSHNNLLATITGLLSAWAWQTDDVLLLTLPLFHTHGLVVGLFCALAAGATVQLHTRSNIQQVLKVLLSGTPTLFFGVPTLYVRLVEALRQHPGPLTLDRMRLFCSGSAPLEVETFHAFQALTGHAILERYGMTETGMNLSNPYTGRRIPGTVGTPLPGVSMRIIDREGKDQPPGSEGELLVRGSNVFSGYWQAPEQTTASFCKDSQGRDWFRTGDLARQDPQTGYVTLLGRQQEMIISGGFNIYPREVEEILTAYPGVIEAAVLGTSHSEWGEVPIAYLVVEEPIDENSLVAYCGSQLASFKIPHQFHYLAALPRNALGKVQKHLLPRQE